jgi:hypothetical protein
VIKALDARPGELPPSKLDHMRRLTDGTGMFQHASFTIPNFREGYTTDDNSRALLVSALLEELGYVEGTELATRYLAFITYAFDPESGRFRNLMDYEHRWIDEYGSDDCLGARCGHSARCWPDPARSLQGMAGRLFEHHSRSSTPAVPAPGLRRHVPTSTRNDSPVIAIHPGRDELANRLSGLHRIARMTGAGSRTCSLIATRPFRTRCCCAGR